MTLQFFGAAQRVTGSKHLVTTEQGKKILLDCGLFQGINTTELNLTFGFNPAEVDYLVLSHAHIDHTGLVPRLVKKGFRGKIICTPATKDLCEVMLLDSAFIQERDLERINKRRKNRKEPEIEILYEAQDVADAIQLFETVSYRQPFFLEDGIELTFFDTAHVLGSAGIFLRIQEGNEYKTLFFTGDIGRPNDKILRQPDQFPQADYLICESTYGNKRHQPEPNVKQHLFDIVQETCVKNRGKLLIPAFSIDRTQELIYALDQLENEGKLPRIKVYVDSPLSVKATEIMKKHEECFNPDVLQYIKRDGDAFAFANLEYITDLAASKALNASSEPCIIISSSGMAEAGRIKHHIRNNIENPHTTILLVGYCSPNSLGGVLKSGANVVEIFGKKIPVKAQVKVMDSFSAHADYVEMIDYLSCQDKTLIKKMFLVHGELDTQETFKAHLSEAGFKNIVIPVQAERFSL